MYVHVHVNMRVCVCVCVCVCVSVSVCECVCVCVCVCVMVTFSGDSDLSELTDPPPLVRRITEISPPPRLGPIRSRTRALLPEFDLTKSACSLGTSRDLLWGWGVWDNMCPGFVRVFRNSAWRRCRFVYGGGEISRIGGKTCANLLRPGLSREVISSTFLSREKPPETSTSSSSPSSVVRVTFLRLLMTWGGKEEVISFSRKCLLLSFEVTTHVRSAVFKTRNQS